MTGWALLSIKSHALDVLWNHYKDCKGKATKMPHHLINCCPFKNRAAILIMKQKTTHTHLIMSCWNCSISQFLFFFKSINLQILYSSRCCCLNVLSRKTYSIARGIWYCFHFESELETSLKKFQTSSENQNMESDRNTSSAWGNNTKPS